jgi:hypothetical protein
MQCQLGNLGTISAFALKTQGNQDVKQTLTFWLQALVTDLFYVGTTSLIKALRQISTYQ